jgi:hypothetical protein
LLLPLPGLSWKIYCDPAKIGETVGELCVLVVGTPVVVAAELPVDGVPELGAFETVVSDVVPVVAAPGLLVDEVPKLGASEGVVVEAELLLNVVVLAAREPVVEVREPGASEGVVSDVVPVVAAPGALVSDNVVPDDSDTEVVVPDEADSELAAPDVIVSDVVDSGVAVSDSGVPDERAPDAVDSEVGSTVGDPEMTVTEELVVG